MRNIEHALIFVICHIHMLSWSKRGVSTERFENIRYYIRNLNFKSTQFYKLIEFNTFQKHSADTKLSTNTYLMSVAAVFQKLQVSGCDISFYWDKATRFNVVRSPTLFTFGYPNLKLSLLQYISFYFNINIATFVGFQIAQKQQGFLCFVQGNRYCHRSVTSTLYPTRRARHDLCRRVPNIWVAQF